MILPFQSNTVNAVTNTHCRCLPNSFQFIIYQSSYSFFPSGYIKEDYVDMILWYVDPLLGNDRNIRKYTTDVAK
jgi:hypothetical protein